MDRASRVPRAPLADQLRWAASLDVVSFHVSGSPAGIGVHKHLLFGIGLPIFLLLTTTLAARSREPSPLRGLARRKLGRLLVPWVVWSALFGAFSVVLARKHGLPGFGWFAPRMLVLGTFYHLWYLPAAFLATLAVNGGVALLRGVPDAVAVAAGGGTALALLELGAFDVGSHVPQHFHTWWTALPAIPLGVALGRLLPRGPGARPRVVLLAAAGAFALGAAAIAQFQGVHLAARYASSAALLSLAFAAGGTPWPWTRRIPTYTMGIYLVHPLVIFLFLHLRTGLDWRALSVLIWVCALALALFVQRTPLGRYTGAGL
jgi:fucose 4-O-acetylase-like acetyltransferase